MQITTSGSQSLRARNDCVTNLKPNSNEENQLITKTIYAYEKTTLICHDKHRYVSFDIAKLVDKNVGNKKWSNFFVKLLRQVMFFATKGV